MGCLREFFSCVFGLGVSSETTACEKPLFVLVVFIFEHFFYSVLPLIIGGQNAVVNNKMHVLFITVPERTIMTVLAY